MVNDDIIAIKDSILDTVGETCEKIILLEANIMAIDAQNQHIQYCQEHDSCDNYKFHNRNNTQTFL